MEKYIQKYLDKIIWFVIIVILAFLLYLIRIIESCILSDDLRWNLIAEIIGVFLTIILLYFLLGWKDQYKWRLVREIIYDLFRREIRLTYSDISMFLEDLTGVSGSGGTDQELQASFKRNYYKKLKERAESQELELFDEALKFAKSGNSEIIFEHRKVNLSNLELKYSKFLEPSIIHTLVLIQDNLYAAKLDLQLIKDNKITDAAFLSNLKSRLHPIIKEIYKLYNINDIDFY